MNRPVEPTHDPTPEPPAPPERDGTHYYGDGCDPPHAPPDETPPQTVTLIIELPAALGAVAAVLEVVGDNWPDAVVDTSSPQGWRITVRDRKVR